MGSQMSTGVRGYSSSVVLARAVGFGFLAGAALGVVGLFILGLYPWGWDSGEFSGFTFALGLALFSAIIGAVIGALVGLFCGGVLLVAGSDALGNRRTVRRIAAVATGSPFVVLAALAAENGAPGWELSGWLWWLVVAAIASRTGAAIGPHVVGGRVDPLAPGHSCFRHCLIARWVLPE
jgi:membrane-associated protease RseP (regulator of RpoE activity)